MMQEADRAKKYYANTVFQNLTIKISQWLLIKNIINYFFPGPSEVNEKRVSTEITEQLQRDFKDVFTVIGCFDGKFSLQIKPDCKPYQVPLRHIAYALQKPFKGEL